MDYSHLQNGSDIRGVAIPGVPEQPVNLTRDAVVCISKAFVVWLKKKKYDNKISIAVGRDSRLSGPSVCSWVFEGLHEAGAKVSDFGLASTPAMFMSTVTPNYEYDGAIMVTASHLPYNRNGLKFFTKDGGVETVDIKDIINIAENQTDEAVSYIPEKIKFMDIYASNLVDIIRQKVNAFEYDKPLSGYHIIVDAGNGSGGFFAYNVLDKLGADTSGSQFLEPDGNFPNHIPNPEDCHAMKSIQDAVLANHADLGIIFDTDVDRAGAVLSDGSEINRNRLIAILSNILIRDHPGTVIVTDSVTSIGLSEYISAIGGIHRRFKRGYRNVIDEAIRLNKNGSDCQLAMETSGHGALKENYFMDDGAYLCVKLLVELGRGNKLADMLCLLKEPKESIEIRMHFNTSDFKEEGRKILEALRNQIPYMDGAKLASDNFEGVRINFDDKHGDGWLLLRQSLHDPLMPLNIESNSVGGTKIIARTLFEFLKVYKALDIKILQEFAK